jgi:hypothetical protein
MVEFGITLFIVAILIIAIWVIIEVKRLRHKIFALFLIALILFTYVSFTVSLRGQDIDMTTVPGVMAASKLYMSWLVSVFNNLKSITTQAISLDWIPNNESKS